MTRKESSIGKWCNFKLFILIIVIKTKYFHFHESYEFCYFHRKENFCLGGGNPKSFTRILHLFEEKYVHCAVSMELTWVAIRKFIIIIIIISLCMSGLHIHTLYMPNSTNAWVVASPPSRTPGHRHPPHVSPSSFWATLLHCIPSLLSTSSLQCIPGLLPFKLILNFTSTIEGCNYVIVILPLEFGLRWILRFRLSGYLNIGTERKCRRGKWGQIERERKRKILGLSISMSQYQGGFRGRNFSRSQ